MRCRSVVGSHTKGYAVDSAICPLNSGCDRKHNVVFILRECVPEGYFYERNVGRVRKVVAARLVHTLHTLQFCAKQNLRKSCFAFGSRHISRYLFSQHHFFFLCLSFQTGFIRRQNCRSLVRSSLKYH